MDSLREQHAAAIPCFRAASGLVVVGLRAPVRDRRGCRHELAQLPGGHELMQLLRRRAEAMLQDDSQRDVARRLDQALAARQGDLERFLEQDVLACLRAALDELEMRVRRREDQDRIDRAVVDDGLQLLRQRKVEILREPVAPFL